jgi:tetratricopeptide (TPR) repeat protein
MRRVAGGKSRNTDLPKAAEADASKRRDRGSAEGRKTDRPCRYRNRAVSDRLERYPNRLEPTRIDVLKQLLEQNPASTFARYGLAMEYVKAGELETAVAEFKAIAAADPGYSAAYFHGGQTLEKLGRLSDARGLYREGIAATRDEHARSEMQAALESLGADD